MCNAKIYRKRKLIINSFSGIEHASVAFSGIIKFKLNAVVPLRMNCIEEIILCSGILDITQIVYVNSDQH